MYSNKRLGQYSLINKEKIKEIIDALDIEDNNIIIEVGSGRGELTKELMSRTQSLKSRIVAIEKDKNLYEELASSNRKSENITFIHGDALKELSKLIANYKLPVTNYKIVGNIPYYITGRLLRTLGELITNYQLLTTIIVLTLQKEVAERLCAKPPKMNLLAASVQFWANPEIIDYIPKEDFEPKPKVDSAIIRLRTRKYEPKNTERYYKLIKALFKQPRKTILNNLAQGFSLDKIELIKKLEEIRVNPNDRPQCLDVSKIQKLSQHLIG
ncbi:MAG: 16S rRNA (adenine(1518)-N(6)/adenine(1519)-N(6))-dimethyltransferase RsmA [Patescibacteria group bacterium]|nr:16S rRNA (adenine(1518)-N(6)/adenine(1519)-N(6))-dimethyltransferase RsmA [Patescibacteria group bacterium]